MADKERKIMHSLNSAVASINKHSRLNLKDEEIKSITKELVKAGFSENITKLEMPILKSTIEHMSRARRSHNPLKVNAEVVSHQSCPLCTTTASSTRLTDVVLAGERPAKYCAEHSVTIPIRSEK